MPAYIDSQKQRQIALHVEKSVAQTREGENSAAFSNSTKRSMIELSGSFYQALPTRSLDQALDDITTGEVTGIVAKAWRDGVLKIHLQPSRLSSSAPARLPASTVAPVVTLLLLPLLSACNDNALGLGARGIAGVGARGGCRRPAAERRG